MRVSEDFREFLKLLNAHEARYLIVGGYAVAYHSRPRYTDDIDIWINPDRDNASRIIRVLADFGFPADDISLEDLSSINKIIQLGLPPQRIDIITSIDGVDFPAAWDRKNIATFAGVPVFIISFQDLLANKKASARDKDMADVKWIETYAGNGNAQ